MPTREINTLSTKVILELQKEVENKLTDGENHSAKFLEAEPNQETQDLPGIIIVKGEYELLYSSIKKFVNHERLDVETIDIERYIYKRWLVID